MRNGSDLETLNCEGAVGDVVCCVSTALAISKVKNCMLYRRYTVKNLKEFE
jgi:hypothetical protein